MKYEVNRWGKIDIVEAEAWTVVDGVLVFHNGPYGQASNFVRGYSLSNLISWEPW